MRGNSILAYFFPPCCNSGGGGTLSRGDFSGGEILYRGYSMLQHRQSDLIARFFGIILEPRALIRAFVFTVINRYTGSGLAK